MIRQTFHLAPAVSYDVGASEEADMPLGVYPESPMNSAAAL